MAKDRTAARPIRLNYRSDETVLVEPDDKDRFLMTARDAARACKQAADDREWVKKFEDFLVYVGRWCQQHAKEVAAAYVHIADEALTILVCTPGEGHRFDLEDLLTELDLAIAEAFPWCIAEVIQLPAATRGEPTSFEKAILVYGHGKGASKASGA